MLLVYTIPVIGINYSCYWYKQYLLLVYTIHVISIYYSCYWYTCNKSRYRDYSTQSL